MMSTYSLSDNMMIFKIDGAANEDCHINLFDETFSRNVVTTV